MMAIVVNGDACKPEDVEKAFISIDGVDAVVSTIGGTTADPTADSQASAGRPPDQQVIWCSTTQPRTVLVLSTSLGSQLRIPLLSVLPLQLSRATST